MIAEAQLRDDEMRVGSLLFADIVDSSGIVDRHDAETAHDIVGAAINCAAQCITRFGGRVNRITGDGVMAMFGAPDGLAEHALAACAAALDMQAQLRALPNPITLRIGVHSGEFLIHRLQAAGLTALDATGATVHLAARLQQAAAPGEALISGATLASAGPAIAAMPLKPQSLRGLSGMQDLLLLQGADLSLSRLDEALGQAPAFVNREVQRRMLAESFARGAAGDGHALLVLGEPGIGKSRLARQAAADAPPGMQVLAGRALRWRRETALHPFADLITRANAAKPEDPALASLLGEEPQDAAWRGLQPSERRARSIAAVTEWVLSRASRTPTAIILDDLHWADEATLEALELLLPALPGRPLLLVLMSRGDQELSPRCRTLPALRLRPLDEDHAVILASRRGVPEAQAAALAARCGGNPFLIEQAAALGDALPPHARALLVERVDRLPHAARDVLQMLAVIEQPVAPGLLAACLSPEMEAAAVHAELATLESAGFLKREGLGTSARVAPGHALLQEVVYRGLTRRRRQAQHARIAERLGALPGADSAMLARQSWLGGLWAEALERNEAAARRAVALYANREAVILLDRALDAMAQLPESPALQERGIDLRLLQREPLFRLGKGDRVTARLREAEALALQVAPGERVAALRVMQVHQAWLTGDLAEAGRVLDVLEAQGEATGDAALLLRCVFQRGLILMSRREHAACAAAMALVAADAAHARHAGRFGVDAALELVALTYQARELADLGEIGVARVAADAGLVAAERLGRPHSWVFAVLSDGYVMHAAGESARAVARLSEALPLCDKAENELMRVVVLMLLGAAEIGLGDLAAAREHLAESVRLAETMRFMALQDVRLELLRQAGGAANPPPG